MIWIVDDSPTEAAITKRTLGPDYDYDYISDGAIVVERLTSSAVHPDLLLLDWVMPGMAGDEVCRFLRGQERTKELPIIIVTASRVETEDLVQGLASGANDYVARPFAPEELRARVEAAIRSRELADTTVRERLRLAAVNQLARVLLQAVSVEAILDTLATVLSSNLCDGCSALLFPEENEASVVRHRRDPSGTVLARIGTVADPCVQTFSGSEEARRTLPPVYHDYIDRFGLTGLAILALPPSSPVHGIVTLTRDAGSEPFDDEDIVTIETCIEYCSLAMQNAMRYDAERNARAKLHAVVEHLPVGVLVSNARGELTTTNHTASLLVPGIERLRELAAVFPDCERVVQQVVQSHARAQAESVVLGADGSERIIAISGVPLRDVHELVVGSVTVLDDVSAERAVLTERERVARFQEEMLAIVGHDLRNPLNALSVGAQLLSDWCDDHPTLAPIVKPMASSTRRMSEIVEQLLDVTHARLGQGIPLQLREAPLRAVVGSVIDELSLAHPETKFELIASEDTTGMWDPDRLGQVVANLAGNAAHYGKEGGPIVVELKNDGGATTIEVRNPIRDQPIPTELQASLFDPFLRGHLEHNSGGLGLGLYIVREIVKAHGGTIEVQSTYAGTKFTVRLEPAH